jgi:competence ComEA-like helix-hairpin-helix protein
MLRKTVATLAIALVIAATCSIVKGQSKKPLPSRPMDLNTATLEQLERLPGVGPVTAQRILDFRKSSGPFLKVEDLLAVKGISSKRLEKIRPYITVKPPAPHPPPKSK